MAKDYSKIVLNPNEIPMWFGGFEEAVDRAIAAGAVTPITFMGIGMSGWVFCDQTGMAFKVARTNDDVSSVNLTCYRLLEDEADFLTIARQLPEKIRKHVVQIHEWRSDLGVIKKACVWGQAGGWVHSSFLHDLHMEIAEAMDPLGWGPPEFKEDSYILDSNGIWVLVDAGFVNRFGKRLADYAEDVVQGRFKTLIPLGYSEVSDLAFSVKMDGLDKRIPEDQAYRLFLELKDMEDRLMKEDVARLSQNQVKATEETSSLWLRQDKSPVTISLSRFKEYPHLFYALRQYIGLEIPDRVPVRWESYKDFLDLFGSDGEEDVRFVSEIRDRLIAGQDIPPLFRDGKDVFDGRHRAWAAHELKIQKAPVVDISPYWKKE